MLIYNVTSKAEWSVAKEWVEWMTGVHIPQVLATGFFKRHLLLRLLEVDEADGPTYAVQYFAESMAEYNQYMQNNANTLEQEVFNKWGNKLISFKSMMQVVN